MKKGFTLIEILVVLSVIALIAVTIMAALNQGRSKARYARTVDQMRLIVNAVNQYEIANTQWPSDSVAGQAPAGLTPTFLTAWPSSTCLNWLYDYDGNPGAANVRVELVKSDGTTVYYYWCVRGSGTCGAPAGTAVHNRPAGSLACD